MRRLLGAALCSAVLVGTLIVPSSARAETPDAWVDVAYRHSLQRRAHVTWLNVDGASSYDLRISRTDSRARRMSAWVRPARLQGTSVQDWHFRVGSGITFCASLRAHLDSGETTAWSPAPGCMVHAFDISRLRTRGAVRTVADQHMYGRKAFVVRGNGRVFLSRVPKGVAVGLVVTSPGRLSGYRFDACRALPISDVAEDGDTVVYNDELRFLGRQRRGCTVTYSRHQDTPRSFPIQAIWVRPRWL